MFAKLSRNENEKALLVMFDHLAPPRTVQNEKKDNFTVSVRRVVKIMVESCDGSNRDSSNPLAGEACVPARVCA